MSIFKDSLDCHGNDWNSSPWRNYIRLPKLKIASGAGTIGTNFNTYLYVMEEDWVGGQIKLSYTTSSNDFLTSIQLAPPSSTFQTASTADIQILGTLGSSKGALSTDTGYNWVAPGLGLKWMPLISPTTTITSSGNHTIDITAEDINIEKYYDAGIHSWLKLSTAVGEGNAQYTKAFPMQCLNRKDILLVHNSMACWPLYNSTSNRDLTVVLQGSMNKGSTWTDLDFIFNAIDPADTATPAVNTNYMIKYVIEGSSYPEYNDFRLKYYIKNDGSVTEALPSDYNFNHISLYPIERH